MVKSDFIAIESNYEYVLGQYQKNALQFQIDFSTSLSSQPWYFKELHRIKDDLQYVSRSIAASLNIDGSKNSGRFARGVPYLIPGIKASVWGETVTLKSTSKRVGNKMTRIRNGRVSHVLPTRDSAADSGGYYGGHVEYGHMLPDGSFYPARPFLRPALRIVSEASLGPLSGTLASVLSGAIAGLDQYRPESGRIISNITYGTSGMGLRFGKKMKPLTYKQKRKTSIGKRSALDREYRYEGITKNIEKLGKSTAIHEDRRGKQWATILPGYDTKSGANKLANTYSVRRSGATERKWQWKSKNYGKDD